MSGPTSPPEAPPAAAPRDGRHRAGTTDLLPLAVSLAIGYVAMLATLAWMGVYAFVPKSAVVPALVVIALVSRRPALFVRDWVVWLSGLLLFDALRGSIYLIAPDRYHVHYVIHLERILFRGVVPEMMQRQWHQPGSVQWWEHALVVVHASHFLVFLFTGAILWSARPPVFVWFKRTLALVMTLGLLGYALVPTAPPWMATGLGVPIAVERIAGDVYTTVVPTLKAAFDVNPVAAMPSLHAAFPVVCAWLLVAAFGRRAWWAWLYPTSVCVAIVYLGEHYAVDVAAGILLAWGAGRAARRLKPPVPWSPRAILAAALILLALAEVAGQMNRWFAGAAG